jgi:hypothetical protein
VQFIYGVIDPFINHCWGLFAVDHNEDDPPYQYLMENLVRHGVLFRVSPDAAKESKDCDFEWPADSSYRTEMEKRFAAAEAL